MEAYWQQYCDLTIQGHQQNMYNGNYVAYASWNGRPAYRNANGAFLYFYDQGAADGREGGRGARGEGDAFTIYFYKSWSLDDRDPRSSIASHAPRYNGGYTVTLEKVFGRILRQRAPATGMIKF